MVGDSVELLEVGKKVLEGCCPKRGVDGDGGQWEEDVNRGSLR